MNQPVFSVYAHATRKVGGGNARKNSSAHFAHSHARVRKYRLVHETKLTSAARHLGLSPAINTGDKNCGFDSIPRGLGMGLFQLAHGLGMGLFQSAHGLGMGLFQSAHGLGMGLIQSAHGLGMGLFQSAYGLGMGLFHLASIL